MSPEPPKVSSVSGELAGAVSGVHAEGELHSPVALSHDHCAAEAERPVKSAAAKSAANEAVCSGTRARGCEAFMRGDVVGGTDERSVG